MTLAEHLIEVLEDAERHSEWQTFDARTLRAAAVFVAELRGEDEVKADVRLCRHGEPIAHSYDHDLDDQGWIVSWFWCVGPGRET